MFDSTELASLLIKAADYYNRQEFMSLDKSVQNEAIADLNRLGALPINAIASVVGVSPYRVREVLTAKKLPLPTARGTLNPGHLPQLSYLLSTGPKIAGFTSWVRQLVREGTSVSVIARLTQISRSTIYRRLEDD